MSRLAQLHEALAAADHIELLPPAEESAVASFEGQHGIVLPPPYRSFLTAVTEGIAVDGEPWLFGLEDISLVLADRGMRPALPFPYDDSDGARMLAIMAKPHAGGLLASAELMSLQKAGSPDGCLQLTDHGDNESCVLVISGPERGRMWRVGQLDVPETAASYQTRRIEESAAMTFEEWLPHWAHRFLGVGSDEGPHRC